MTKGSKKEYHYAVGRRKTAVARVRLYEGKETGVIVNGKPLEEYFPIVSQQKTVTSPIELVGKEGIGRYEAKVLGGGTFSQSEAVRHGIARVLLKYDLELRSTIKKAGYLRRDPRMKERKKPGLKKARKAPQWAKR